MKIQNFLLKNIFEKNKKNFNFLSDRKAYFMGYLLRKLRHKKNHILYFSPNIAFFSTLKILFIQLINFLSKNDFFEVGFFLLPFNKINLNKIKSPNKKYINDYYSDIKYINHLLIESNIFF